jgi:hypothetical protein
VGHLNLRCFCSCAILQPLAFTSRALRFLSVPSHPGAGTAPPARLQCP